MTSRLTKIHRCIFWFKLLVAFDSTFFAHENRPTSFQLDQNQQNDENMEKPIRNRAIECYLGIFNQIYTFANFCLARHFCTTIVKKFSMVNILEMDFSQNLVTCLNEQNSVGMFGFLCANRTKWISLAKSSQMICCSDFRYENAIFQPGTGFMPNANVFFSLYTYECTSVLCFFYLIFAKEKKKTHYNKMIKTHLMRMWTRDLNLYSQNYMTKSCKIMHVVMIMIWSLDFRFFFLYCITKQTSKQLI